MKDKKIIYPPPGGWSPKINEGGRVSILKGFVAVQQNEGGWGYIKSKLPGESSYVLRENRIVLDFR